MLRGALFIARKDLRFTFFQKETLLWTFVMPIVFFYFIGSITGGMGPPSTKVALAVVADESAGFLLDELEKRLEEDRFAVRHPESAEDLARYTRRLVVPPDFTEKALAGEAVELQYLTRSSSVTGGQFDEIRVQRAAYTVLADLVVVSESGEPITSEDFAALAAKPRSIDLNVTSAGKRVVPPSGFDQAVPGILVMFTLLVLLTSGAVLLVIEREQGLLRRLASSPLSRGEVVAGKWIARMTLALIQIVFAMGVGSTPLFKQTWGGRPLVVLGVLIAWGAFCASLGLLVGSLARSVGQAIGFGVVGTNLLAAIGGCWWPIEVTPSWMQTLARCVPTGWAMNSVHKLVNFGEPAASVLPYLALLLGFALIAGVVAARRFRYE